MVGNTSRNKIVQSRLRIGWARLDVNNPALEREPYSKQELNGLTTHEFFSSVSFLDDIEREVISVGARGRIT